MAIRRRAARLHLSCRERKRAVFLCPDESQVAYDVIVDPDFCDHWKTRMLVGALEGDELAPLYVIRLWAHCQNRRQSTFDNLTMEALKALCRYSGHANQLESAMVTSGFVRREDDGSINVVGWDEYNATLIAAWKNGLRGGRPKTQPKPTGKPTGLRLDGIGLDSPPNPHGGDSGVNSKRRKRDQFHAPPTDRTPPSVKAWIQLHDEAVIPRDHPTVTRILTAASTTIDAEEFLLQVSRIAKGLP